MKNVINFLRTFLLIIALLITIKSSFAEEEKKFSFSGHYKNLLVTSEAINSDERYFVDTNRLRLELNYQAEPWQFRVEADNELLIHDAGNIPDFDIVRSREHQRVNSFDSDVTSVDNDHLYLRHSLYRAFVKYYQPNYQVTVGKQGIDWGRMRFFSPLDLFNPVGPIDLERDQRIGVDAINYNYSADGFTGFSSVIAPGVKESESRYALRYYRGIGTYDLSFIAANILRDKIVGILFDGYLGEAGLRGELTQTFQKDEARTFPRVSLGLDYTFSSKFYALVEQFYNGGNDDNNSSTFFTSYKRTAQTLSQNKNLTGLWLQYKFTPLKILNTYIIYDWDDQSVVINPEFKFDATKNFDILTGAQFFGGDNNSEFGDLNTLAYVELKWFF